MQLSTDDDSLAVYEALASPVRLRIIRLLQQGERSVKEVAGELNLSNPMASIHISKLEKAGIISCRNRRIQGGTYKFCSLSALHMQINLSADEQDTRKLMEIAVPVGQYTDIEAWPTCGLATIERLIGEYDNPRYFLDPERVQAGILWFAKGHVEYKVPNYLFAHQSLRELEVSMEIGSEAPLAREHWPSDIRFYLNGQYLGKWTSPGDYGDRRGRLTPDWWPPDINQYGLLKRLRINDNGTFMDGQRISDCCISDLDQASGSWTLRLSAENQGRSGGGLTLFGRGFGNYDQDVLFRVYYDQR